MKGKNNLFRWYTQKQAGYITLLSVLIVGVVGIAITVSLLTLGLGSSRTSFTREQGTQARTFADACAEEALQQIRDTTSYTGNGSVSFSKGTCTYIVTSQGGENRTITASSTVGTLTQRVKVVVGAINPTVTITSWQEVSSF